MEIFAHSVEGKAEEYWEPLAHHLSAVGGGAAKFAAPFGCSTIALAMGLLHDIGKSATAYQTYIRRPRDSGGPKGPDHSTAGAKEAIAAYGNTIGRIMAFGIAGHHAGLADGAGHESGSLQGRLDKTIEDYGAWRDHVDGLPTAKALTEGSTPPKANCIDGAFSASFLVRMLFSCLVDADFRETEAFYARSRGGPPPERGGALEPRHRDIVRAHMARHRRDDTPVNRLRSAILDHANAKASLEPGLFTLTVPTGGGKTLTSLSFAMEHALAHDLRRIIYVIPFTEAWIETRRRSASSVPTAVASRAEAWIETVWRVALAAGVRGYLKLKRIRK